MRGFCMLEFARMDVLQGLTQKIKEILNDLGFPHAEVAWEHPEELAHGDYSTNVSLVYAKPLKKNPKELAEAVVKELLEVSFENIEKIEIAGPGFINIYFTRHFFTDSLQRIVTTMHFGKTTLLEGKKVMIEYTDPNPFKEFHIGHLMSNTIGESISRIVEWNGAEVKRACYQGDVGIHVAKAVWALLETDMDTLSPKILGQAYAKGANAYADASIKEAIEIINKKIYNRSDEVINRIYDTGRKASLEHFEIIYKKLGTTFDFYFFESESGAFGQEVVNENIEKGIFENSDGATVFKGEKYNPKLHTRVFINSQGLPTYEAKELGLAKIKYDSFAYDQSIVITGNEIDAYFQVLLEAMRHVFPDLAKKTKHISHGMLRLPTGKMSSRTGDVITGESLLAEVSEKAQEKINQNERGAVGESLVNDIAVSAIKYSILKQATGRDIIFDFEKSLSFEGDSGPYLQYAYARARSIIEKGKSADIQVQEIPETITELEKLLYRFPEIVMASYGEYAPHTIANYLIEIARSFNSFYGQNQIVNTEDPMSGYKILLTEAFARVIKNGLTILGIKSPEKM